MKTFFTQPQEMLLDTGKIKAGSESSLVVSSKLCTNQEQVAVGGALFVTIHALENTWH